MGIPADYVQAYLWLSLAAGNGSRAAMARRDRLADDMTATQVAEAETLIEQWSGEHRRARPAPIGKAGPGQR